jgi:ssDNA-specific exonuclease RecJ
VWLPDCAEKHVVMMAAAKIGLKVVDVDMDVTELSAVRSFLAETKPKAIYFKPQHDDADYLLLLRKAIPEFFECTCRRWSVLFEACRQQ